MMTFYLILLEDQIRLDEVNDDRGKGCPNKFVHWLNANVIHSEKGYRSLLKVNVIHLSPTNCYINAQNCQRYKQVPPA